MREHTRRLRSGVGRKGTAMRVWLQLTHLFGLPEGHSPDDLMQAALGPVLRAAWQDVVDAPLPEPIARLPQELALRERPIPSCERLRSLTPTKKAGKIKTGAVNTVQASQITFVGSTAEDRESHFYQPRDAAQAPAGLPRGAAPRAPRCASPAHTPWTQEPATAIPATTGAVISAARIA
jgi:hypothetical protein